MQGEAAYPALYRGFSDYCAGFEGPLALAGLSLGGILALDYTIQNPGRVGALVLIAAPYKMPKKMLAVQDFVFRLMPKGAFKGMGFSKEEGAVAGPVDEGPGLYRRAFVGRSAGAPRLRREG